MSLFPRTTLVNFNKANWKKFKANQLEIIWVHYTNVLRLESLFHSTLISPAKASIHTGRRQLYDPYSYRLWLWILLMKEPLFLKMMVPQQALQISTRETSVAQNTKWRSFVKDIDPASNAKPLWNTINAIDGKPRESNNSSICFGGRHIASIKNIANQFVKFYTFIRKHVSSLTSPLCAQSRLKSV